MPIDQGTTTSSITVSKSIGNDVSQAVVQLDYSLGAVELVMHDPNNITITKDNILPGYYSADENSTAFLIENPIKGEWSFDVILNGTELNYSLNIYLKKT